MLKRHVFVLAATVLFVGACGGDSDGEDSSSSDESSGADTETAEIDPADAAAVEEAVTDAADDAVADAEEFADDIVDDLEAAQESEGGGGATLIVDGQTYEFPAALCAFGEDQIGQPGAVFNMSAIDNGLQLYASIDDSGAAHSLSLNDIEDFENPSVSLSIASFLAGAAGLPTEFLVLDGKQVSADIVMYDDLTSLPTENPAQFSGTCP